MAIGNKWMIEEFGGKYDVKLNRHSTNIIDCDDIEEALTRLKRSKRYKKGDTIMSVDHTGYQQRIR